MENDNIVCTVENDQGRRFNVRLVRRGDRYGLNDCLVHGAGTPKDHTYILPSIAAEGGYDGAMIEFYDATYANTKDFGSRGQFVSRYYLSTLDDGTPRGGINLCGYEPVWQVNATNARDAIASARRALGMVQS